MGGSSPHKGGLLTKHMITEHSLFLCHAPVHCLESAINTVVVAIPVIIDGG